MPQSHIYNGIAFPGRHDIKIILAEIERQKKARVDVVVPSCSMLFQPMGAKTSAPESLNLHVNATEDLKLNVPLSKRAWTQMATWLGIRQTDRLYKWLTQGYQIPSGRKDKGELSRNWPTWATLMNSFMHTENEKRLIRVIADKEGNQYCRALLSDKYNIVSNDDFFYCIVKALEATDAEVVCARLSEDRFYGYAVSKGLTGDVDRARANSTNPAYEKIWKGAPNDTFNAAMVFGNSETGEGGIFISAAILRSVDKTFHILQDIVSTTHVGKRYDPMEKLLSDETIRKKNELFFAKVTDYVKGAFDPEKFAAVMAELHSAAHDPIDDPERAAEALQLVFPISDAARSAIRNKFIESLDNSRFGLANAISVIATAKDLNADAGFALERISSAVISDDMESIYSKANRLRKEKNAKAAEDAASSDILFESLKRVSGAGRNDDLFE